MDTERFLRLRSHFDKAVSLPADERQIYIREFCNGDLQFAIELRRLLSAHDKASSFIEHPVDIPASAMPCETTSERQTRIGPYRILRLLGSGGMGDVYLAVRDDGAFRKYVALKRIRKEVLRESTVVERFRSERQVLAGLDHPNIARILDAGDTEDGSPYCVMEFIEGVPLDQYSNEKKLSLERRLQLLQKVIDAVHYLHTCQVIHRDIKPSNILVTPDGTPKLLDFGIAKILGPAAPNLTGAYNAPLTPLYASPEQLAGRTVTVPSDIYSLGVVFYLLITGSLPDPLKILPPSVAASNRDRMPESESQLKRRIYGDLEKVVLKTLERDPSDRYRTAQELNEDISRFLDNRTVMARRAPITEKLAKFVSRNRLAVAVAALVIVLASSSGWFALKNRSAQSELNRLNTLMSQLNSNTGSKDLAAISRNLSLLRGYLANSLMKSGNLNKQQLQLRNQILQGSVKYLQEIDALAYSDPKLARQAGELYLRVAELQQSESQPQIMDRAGTIASYQAAARLFVRVAGTDSATGDAKESLATIEQRLKRLEAQVPDDVVAILYPVAVKPGMRASAPAPVVPRQRLDPGRKSRFADEGPAPGAPPLLIAAEEVPPELQSLRIRVLAKAETAEEHYLRLKAEMDHQGYTINSTATENYKHMQASLAEADRQFDQRDFVNAAKSLEIARTYATRIIENR